MKSAVPVGNTAKLLKVKDTNLPSVHCVLALGKAGAIIRDRPIGKIGLIVHWLDRSLIERCAHPWMYINSFGYESVRDYATLIRYEDLVRSPLAFAEDVCAKIGLSSTDSMRTLEDWANRVQNTNNQHFVEALTSRSHSRPDQLGFQRQ